MTVTGKNKTGKNTSGSRIATVIILFLVIIAIAGYFIFSPSKKTDTETAPAVPAQSRPAAQKSLSPETSVSPSPALPALPPQKQPKPENEPLAAFPEENAKAQGTARLSIIIDDIGNSMSEARALAAIKVPLTFAIIPGLRVDKEVAAFAAAKNIETIIHIPMQSIGWPERRLEANGLLVAMSADELQERVAGFIEQFPGALGANNHMGSEFTKSEEKMTAVLQILKKNNLFFVDSVTSAESSGGKVARQNGVRFARRNVFLDNSQERGYILAQLNQAVRFAKKNGSAIAICHPHQSTIAALASALPMLASQGVQLVGVSQLVK